MSDLARRIVVQQLESLQRMGVCQLGKRLDAVKGPPSDLEALALEVSQCTKCTELAASRTQTVFGVGNPRARLCFFGEAPGADEDRKGEPFVSSTLWTTRI